MSLKKSCHSIGGPEGCLAESPCAHYTARVLKALAMLSSAVEDTGSFKHDDKGNKKR